MQIYFIPDTARRPSGRHIVLPVLLSLFLSLCLAGQVAAEATTSLQGLLEVKQRELTMLTNAEEGIAESVDQSLDDAKSAYGTIRKQYEEALLAQGLSLASPIEERSLSRQLQALERRLSKTLESLQDISDQASVRLDRLGTINTRSDFVARTDLSDDMQAFVTTYLRQIMQLRARLDAQQNKAETQLKQVKVLLDKIRTKRKQKEEGLATHWKEYFFRNTDPLVSVELWRQPGSVPLWLSVRMVAFTQELSLLESKAFSAALLALFVFTVVASGGIPLMRAALRGEPVSNHVAAKLHRSGLTGTIGFALVMADMRVFGGAAPSFSVFSWFLFGYGVLMGSNAIRRVVLPNFSNIPKTPLSWLFLLGGLMLVSEMPNRLAVPLWATASLVFLAFMLRRHMKNSSRGTAALSIWFWMAVLFALLAMAGYARFSAFICMLWFVSYVAYGVSTGLMATLNRSLSSLPDEGGYVMLKGAILGLASPLVWTGSASLGLYWLYQFLGEGILRTVGDLTISWEGFSLKFASVLLLAILFYVTRACSHLARGALDRMAERWPKGQRGSVLSLKTMANYGLWFVYGLVGLHILGVSLTSLTVVAGGLSVGIGFGMQTIFNNFFSGLILLFGRSIQQGDIIQVGDLWCTVRTINIRATVVETFDNASLIIPNSDLVTTQVTNWTKNNATIRRDLLVGVAYGSDTELVRKTLTAVAEAHPHVLRRPQPAVLFNDFGASSLDFILRVWINDIDNALTSISELRFAIDKAFREEGIEIAFPQMDLHIRTAPALQELQAAQVAQAKQAPKKTICRQDTTPDHDEE
ncbi:mechanosensitive ion channel [Desulfovibrio mangrovi]|uniref:mechanosensitive ion channel domain-containing protein n=1 Tax=Desulfovibrio mangrovi TaxID=2976983 RepID=UPI00224673BB|nr:mechanosensitive ion channel domain-containing protein [Desulfovibrio mangrovi]UZP66982.1 mechanosensitive ion channel [Desulfovibrio mangrovi]